MSTSTFELRIVMPCENDQVVEAVADAVTTMARQFMAVAVLLSHDGMPEVRLRYHTATAGKVTRSILPDEPEPEILADPDPLTHPQEN